MKFVIPLLAFFISLLTSAAALDCYKCSTKVVIGTSHPARILTDKGPGGKPEDVHKFNCTISKGVPESCKDDDDDVSDLYCLTITENNELHSRGCIHSKVAEQINISLSPGCQTVTTSGHTADFCLCNCDDLCNVYGCKGPLPAQPNSNTKMAAMSVTTLLGGVLALSL